MPFFISQNWPLQATSVKKFGPFPIACYTELLSACRFCEKICTEGIAALNFNLYKDFYPDKDKSWSMELVGTNSFDADDGDWACDEVYDFDTRENPFPWTENTEWDIVLDKIVQILNRYMTKGLYADRLKQYDGIGVAGRAVDPPRLPPHPLSQT